MSYDMRIDDLVEEILNSDRAAEDVCAQYPELLSEVQARLARLRIVEAQIDGLFPVSEMSRESVRRIIASESELKLPSIQGYEMLAILGRGGMGVVYQARHLRLNRVVALKMLLAGSHASPQVHMRFMREAEAVAGLRHPNIVQLYDFGEVEGQPYYTMEYVSGGSLAQKMSGASQPIRESAVMVATLAKAVSVAHQSGVIHRNLKPANILLVEDGTPKISDFGVARRINEDGGLTQTGYIVGTPNYMAPEQMTGSSSSIGPAADVFALGIILYEMLTGHAPFRGESFTDTQRRLTMEDPVAPSRLNAKVPRDLETICLRCLEKDPTGRYASAADLDADLDRFLRHEPILARPMSRVERCTRWVRRNPLGATLAVTAVILVGLIVGSAIHESNLAAERRAERSRLTARLESGIELVQGGRYAEARAILGELGDGGYDDLRQRIDRTLADVHLVEEIDAIGVRREFVISGQNDSSANREKAVKEYEAVFERTGFGKVHDDPAVVALRIRESDIHRELVAALDDWAVCEKDKSRRNWLLEVARSVAPNPSEWSNRARDPTNWNTRDALSRLADDASAAKPPIELLRALGDRLSAAGLDSIPLRTRVQQDHADSFSANFNLANALREKKPSEAVRYYQAALAVRPSAVPARNNLAVALATLRRDGEAEIHFRQALELSPQSPYLHYNLGYTLNTAGRTDEAIVELQQATTFAPSFALAYGALGQAFFEEQKYSAALAALRTYLDLTSRNDPARSRMADLLRRCEQLNSGGK